MNNNKQHETAFSILFTKKNLYFQAIQELLTFPKAQKKLPIYSEAFIKTYLTGVITICLCGSDPSEKVFTLLLSNNAVWITFRSYEGIGSRATF